MVTDDIDNGILIVVLERSIELRVWDLVEGIVIGREDLQDILITVFVSRSID